MERKSKKFWGTVDGIVKEVTGYECFDNAGAWWVPELGYSLWDGEHLFSTEEEAKNKARERLKSIITEAEEKINKLG